MPRKKNINFDDEYLCFGNPDHSRLAQLILEAKGNRTLSQFAKLCNVSPSTLTRIVNGDVKGRISNQLIFEISKNTENVSIEDLMYANGKISKTLLEVHAFLHGKPSDGKKQLIFDFTKNQKLKLTRTEKRIFHAIETTKKSLSENNIHYNKIQPYKNIVASDNLRFIADFVIDFEDRMHAFDVHNSYYRTITEKLIDIFGVSYIGSFVKTPMLISIITDEVEEFTTAKKLFGNTRIRDNITIILVDLEKRITIDQFTIPMLENES